MQMNLEAIANMVQNKGHRHMHIKAVIFDLDNTLTHRDLSVQAYSQRLCDVYAAQLQGRPLEQVIDIIRRIDRGGYPKKELLTQATIGGSVAEALIQQLDWIDPPDLDRLTQFWFSHFGASAVAMPNAAALLLRLKQQGYRLAVISNGGHQTRLNILNGLGFIDHFDVIVSSELVGISKPSPEIFHYTAQQLNLSPTACLYIGDHPINDIVGATTAGMQSLWLEGFHETVDEPKHKIQNLAQVSEYLEHLTQNT